EVIKASTLPHAYREIDRLRHQVRDLERQVQLAKAAPAPSIPPSVDHYLPSPSNQSSSTPAASPAGITPDHSHQQRYWRGIHIRTARSPQETWYGPSSLYYFIGRVSNFMNSTMLQSDPAHQMLPKTSSSVLFDGPSAAPADDPGRRSAVTTEDTMAARAYLSPTQEEYFLDLYWHAYHTCLFPILNEAEFRDHYRSLWTAPGHARKPSALVDILLALCMQRGVSSRPSVRGQKPPALCDASIAGRQYFRRYRRLVQYEMESPTMSTLQSHMLCCIYFCNGTFMNMTDNECGLAVRTAYMLGLHREPPPTLPRRERELRKRIWWSLYMLDTKVGTKLGRPFLLNRTNAEPSLPDDGPDAALESGSHFAAPDNGTTWISFSLQQVKLVITAREAHTAFYSRRLDIRDDQTIWDDPHALEAHARFMQPYARAMEDWSNNVPSALNTKREGNGLPLSTDGTALEVEQFAPLWLQRQRILLELVWHNMCVYLYRPFITFSALSPSPTTPTLAEQTAVRGALHATALTRIMHQLISSTDIITGWHEAFQWQWNAAVTLVGFVLAYPHSPTTPAARSAIDMAVVVFDIFSGGCVVSSGAADITRKLAVKVDLFRQHAHGTPGVVGGGWAAGDAPGSSAPSSGFDEGLLTGSGLPGTGMSQEALSFDFDSVAGSTVQDVFQMAVAVDQWSGLDLLWPPGDMWPEEGPM
ncbi:fungal specific transcription factor domain-containing protein, partial [Candidatus Bathyarchaeota archaeon]|nr:fungal specific transcription factor domain-containing protein [Candidatus Bathyarchaeota archaeon]